jgi:hypothetical protein
MAPRDIQTIVDELAVALARPVGVDDSQFRSLAYSAHLDGADAVRLASILRRVAPAAVRSWLIGDLRIHLAREPVRIPASATLGMAPRMCVPIRFDDLLLGYLWLMDGEPALGNAELAHASTVATQLSEALYHSRLLENADRSHEQALLSELMLGDPSGRRAAAHQLRAGGFIARSSGYRAVCLIPIPDERLADDRVRVRLAGAAQRSRRIVSDSGALSVVLDDRIVVLHVDERDDIVDRIAEVAADALTDVDDVRAAVGSGSAVDGLASVSRSLREATVAALVAGRMRASVRRWESLGSLQVLGAVEAASWMWDVLAPLLEAGFEELLITLESYLDRAGNSADAARQLHLHRTTLYHRLRQIERLCELDLRDGDDRLRLHLALRLYRLHAGAAPT